MKDLMRFSVDRMQALQAIARIAPVLDRASVIPDLKFMLIDAQPNGEVRFAGRRPEIEAQESVPCDISLPGQAILPGDRLRDIFEHLAEETVHLTADENHGVMIQCGKTAYYLESRSAENFPINGPKKAEQHVLIPNFAQLARKTLFCVRKDNQAPALTNIVVRLQKGKLSFTSCDAVGLAEASVDVAADFEFQVYLPASTIQYIAGVLPGKDTTVAMGLCGNYAVFTAGGLHITALTSAAAYPATDNIWAALSPQALALVSGNELYKALHTLNIPQDKLCTLTLNIGAEHIELESNSCYASSRWILEAVAMAPTPKPYHYPLRTFLPAASVLRGANVKMSISPNGMLLLEAAGYRFCLTPSQAFSILHKAREQKEKNKAAAKSKRSKAA